MFLRLFAALLLLLAGFAAYRLAFPGEAVPPILKKTRAAAADETSAALEKTADYWLSAGNAREAGELRGSGTALALAIRVGRLEALRSGTEAVPSSLRRSFEPHFSDAVLDEARWTVAEPGTRLARVLGRWPVKEGAVTLGNVIVFKTEKGSRNRSLFVHELTHVEQYGELGIGEFARRYAANPDPLEAEARQKAKRVMRSL